MKVLSKSSEYGIRALLYIVSQNHLQQNAENDQARFLGIGEIAEALGLSFYFLTKIFRKLTDQGILTSYRGPNGGVALGKPANEIMTADVVLILEGKNFFDKCLLGLPGCGELTPCPVHHLWSHFKVEFKENLFKTSLADLGEKANLEKLRL